MDPQLKQRLVGAAVLVALAVIVIPAFLEQDTSAPLPVVQRDMAPMPADDLPTTLTPVDPSVMAEVASGIEASSEDLAVRLPEGDPVPAPAEVAPPPPSVPDAAVETGTPDAAPAPEAPPVPAPDVPAPTVKTGDWVVQLGSFASEDNAATLLARVRKAGFSGYIAPLAKQGKRSYRVRVGGSGERPDAERLHARLAQTLGFSGMVVRAD